MQRLARRVGIAVEGVTISLAVAGTGVVLWAIGLAWPGIVLILVAGAIAAFFRDPERTPPTSSTVVLSAADGKVSDVGEAGIPGDSPGARYHRVSVFMSPLNVHVNRAPVAAEVVEVRHTPGAFHAAFRDYASERNERNLVILNGDDGRRHAMMQVAGYLARRIVCRLRPHDRVRPGERVGLIMFGSRVDHFIPPEYRVVVTVGQRVRAGESVIGVLS